MDTMPTGFVQSLLYLEKGSGTSVCFKANTLVYDSRNLLSLSAIEEGFDRVLWLDSDMMFTKDTLKILMKDMDTLNADMVTGVYFKRRPPYSPVIHDELQEPTFDKDDMPASHVHEYLDYPQNAVFPVKACGFGCVLTSTKLLKHVWDSYGPAFAPLYWAGEDLSFCYRVNQLGYTIYCDSNVSCGHIGQFVFTEDFYQSKRRGEKFE